MLNTQKGVQTHRLRTDISLKLQTVKWMENVPMCMPKGRICDDTDAARRFGGRMEA